MIPLQWWLHTFAVCMYSSKHWRHLGLVFLLFLKVIRKNTRNTNKMKDAGLWLTCLESHSCAGKGGGLKTAKNNFLLEPALKWLEESTADRTPMTSVYQNSHALRMPPFDSELQTHGQPSLPLPRFRLHSQSGPHCRKEQDFQAVAHRIIFCYEYFIHIPKS